ncbi:fumarylacetoacetate hydrolase family protein [Xanthobacteraceae bacterium Astr-EGSB]|uniref:fumarylacetoacetate hydrolase family protein n=1 Tax=Astrobacterium formosum TaxID=3069710 RepID=UPI0027B6C6C8|nr:fumarylacetoacetate hydrolase family protein [Xanthobacteraceae bacterium Astr-EGSB]
MRIVRYADGTIKYGILDKDGTIRPLVGTPFESLETTGPSTHLDKVRLLSPVAPRNLYGVGLNYVKHAQEVKQPLPAVPMLFMKPTSAVIGPEAPILYPSTKAEKNVHFEAEVAVVIGKTARRTGEARALDHVLGYTCGNDVSERVIQAAEMKQGCLLIGKAYDSFNPLGPAIETDLDPGNITILGRVNGEARQNSNTNDLVYSIRRLVAYLSDAFTLLPGDVIMTGTPSGVGPIVPGDVVEIEIPQVGILRNPVIDDATSR